MFPLVLEFMLALKRTNWAIIFTPSKNTKNGLELHNSMIFNEGTCCVFYVQKSACSLLCLSILLDKIHLRRDWTAAGNLQRASTTFQFTGKSIISKGRTEPLLLILMDLHHTIIWFSSWSFRKIILLISGECLKTVSKKFGTFTNMQWNFCGLGFLLQNPSWNNDYDDKANCSIWWMRVKSKAEITALTTTSLDGDGNQSNGSEKDARSSLMWSTYFIVVGNQHDYHYLHCCNAHRQWKIVMWFHL